MLELVLLHVYLVCWGQRSTGREVLVDTWSSEWPPPCWGLGRGRSVLQPSFEPPAAVLALALGSRCDSGLGV